jgi:hypothetical protein
MIYALCIKKIRDNNGRVREYILKDKSNSTIQVDSNKLKQAIRENKITVENLKLTSDNKLINTKINQKEQSKTDNCIILYHGSPCEKLIPTYGKGENKHDYGKGLYLTKDIELAREWAVASNKNGYVHKFMLDTTGLSILNFDSLNELHWIAELMSHRDADSSERYKRLAPLFIEKYKINTDKYDIIKGWRADSSFFYIGKQFVKDNLDINLLKEALRIGDLGIQWCMKSEKSMKRLISKTNYSAIEEVNKQAYYKKYNDRDIKAREDVKRLIQSDRNTCRNVFSTLI